MKRSMRLLSFVMACCMLVNVMPAGVRAAETGESQTQEERQGTGQAGGTEPDTEIQPLADDAESDSKAQPLADSEAVYQQDLKIWFDAASGTVTDADEDIKTLDLPDSIEGEAVRAVGDSAFSGCSSLTEITFPAGIESIGNSAFSGCSSLVSIHIPDGVEKIGWYTFSSCRALEEVFLPDNVTEIDDGAFQNCVSLESIVIPDSTKQVGLVHDKYDQTMYGYSYCGVFSGCAGLKDVTVGSGLATLGNNAFSGCTSLEAIRLPDGLNGAGGEAFSGCTALKSVELPGSLGAIGYGMFSGCTALEEIEIPNGVTVIGTRAFSGCLELSSVLIPESVTCLGEGYYFINMDLIIDYCGGVFKDCPKLSYITVPESVTEIPDSGHPSSSGVRVSHTANFDAAATLRVKEGSRAEEYAHDNDLNYMFYFDEKELALCLRRPDGSVVADGYRVTWYEHGKDAPIANGRTLSVTDGQKQYDYELSLSDELLETYELPARQTAELKKEGSGYVAEYVLTKREEISVTGQVTDEAGAPVFGAAVVFEQTYGKFSKSVTVTTDTSGNYEAVLSKVPTKASCHADGFARLEAGDMDLSSASLEMEPMRMKRLSPVKIRLSMEKVHASKESGKGRSEAVTSCGGMEFTLYNETRGKAVDSFEAQYPYLYLDEDAAGAGDVIRITAEDVSKTLAPARAAAELSDDLTASAALLFTALGSFTATADRKAVAMVFDGDGAFVSQCAGGKTLDSGPLAAGTYSAVLMQNTPLLSGAADLSTLDGLGLVAGKDYLLQTVQISDGSITDLGAVRVPDFDASAFCYTVQEKTGCTAKKSEVPVGSLLSVKMEYEIREDCGASGEEVVLDLPDGISVISGSLTVDGKQSNYLERDKRVTVDTGKRAAVLRFYVSASDAGAYQLNSYIRFQTEGKTVLQPVGTAAFTATGLSLSALSETGSKTAVVDGSALPKSRVWVYDNNVRVASCEANAAGLWSVRFDLVNPGSYSKHAIYAEIVSAYGVRYRTGAHMLTYDKDQCDLERITMVHSGSEIVIDQFAAGGILPSYSYNPTAPFSFKLEFTGDDVENVELSVTGSDGSVSKLVCVYDKENKCYVTAYPKGNAVAGVSASFDRKGAKSVYSFTGESGGEEGKDHAYSPAGKGSVYHEASEDMAFGIVDIYPKKAAKGTITLFLDGRLFEPGLSVALSDGANEYAAKDVYWVNHQRVYATFDLWGAPDGTYSVTSACKGKSDTLSDCFTVDSSLEKGKGSIEMNLSKSVKTGEARKGSITVTNAGHTDIYAPVIKLFGENLKFKLSEEDDYASEGEVFVQNKEGLAGIIAPGETAGVEFTYKTDSDGKFELKADDYSRRKGDIYGQVSLTADSDISDILTANALALIGRSYSEYTESMAKMACEAGASYDGPITVELLESLYEQNARGELGGGDGFSVADLSAGALSAQRTFSNSLHRKQVSGAFGKGWVNDYDWKAEYLNEDGTECILLTGGDAVEIFAKNPEGDGFIELFAGEDTAERRADGTILVRSKNEITQTFGSGGLCKSVSDKFNNTVEFAYQDGTIASVTSSDGDSLVFSVENGKIASVSSPVTGDTATYQYDGDYLESVTTKYGTTIYHYDKSSIGGKRGTLAGIDYPDGTGVSYSYDDLGRVKSVADHTGTATYEYGLAEILVSDQRGHTARTHYDLTGNVLWNLDAYGDVCYYEYDKFSYVTKESFGLFDHAKYQYNDKGELAETRSADQTAASYSYDSHGGIAGVTDPLGRTVRYDEDENGMLGAVVYPDGNKERYTYDEKGNLASATDADGVTAFYAYDEKSNLISVTYSTGNKISYAYNEKGDLTRVNEDGKITEIAYEDERGDLARITYPDGKTVSYSYDACGRRTSVTDGEGNVTRYEYDENGRLFKVYDGEMEAVSYTYHSDGTLAKQQNANGTYTTYDYKDGTLSELCNYGADGSALSRFAYAYDKYGHVNSMETAEGVWNYEYDRAGQLVKAISPEKKVTEYVYDAAGNRVSVTKDGQKTDYAANEMNQCLTAGDVVRSYDKNGNLLTETSDAGQAAYEWDYRGRLSKVTTMDGHVYEYEYDAFGGRSKVTADGVSTEYLNDPTGSGYALASYSGGNVTRYLLSGGICAMDAGSGLYFYSFNHLGSTVGITAPDGSLANRYVYDQEGGVTEKSETVENPYTYAGAYGIADDGNGLWYDRARYVSKATGSFVSMDPAGQYYDLNLYRFVGNNPVNYIDVSGEFDSNFVKAIEALNQVVHCAETGEIGPAYNEYVKIEPEPRWRNFDWRKFNMKNWFKQGRAVSNGARGAKNISNSYKAISTASRTVQGARGAMQFVTLGNRIGTVARVGGTVLMGCTMLELLIALVVLSLVIAIVAPSVIKYIEKSKLNALKKEQADSSSSVRGSSIQSKNSFFSYIIDPSGYVYEGVTSNRLEGVKAVVYYEDYPKDEFGQPDEEAGLGPVEWTEAEDYGEINPQYTNLDGEYGWDVPPGRWKVRFSKEGYEDYETDWMEVPPEYTDVNINLKNLAAPIMETVNVYSDCVQILFSQYMDVESVTSDTFQVQMDGKTLDGTVKPVDAGSDYEGNGEYASIFEFYPNETLSGSVTVEASGAKSYCGNEMEGGQRTKAVTVKPESVEISLAESVVYKGSVPMSIDITPGEAGKFLTAEIRAKTPAVADTSAHKVSLDKNGHAEVLVSGNMPGDAVFEIKVNGTALHGSKNISVIEPEGSGLKPDPEPEPPVTPDPGPEPPVTPDPGPESPVTPDPEPEPPVTKTDLSDCSASLEYESAVYTGEAFQPAVTATCDGKTLAEGTDYDVSYRDNVNAGTASAVITGKGNYTGTKEIHFTIQKAKNAIHLPGSSYSFDASPIKEQELMLGASADGGRPEYRSDSPFVTAGQDGKVVIARNFAGTATISVTVKDSNYETVSATVSITVNRIHDVIEASDFTRTAKKKAQKFSIKAACAGKGKLSYRSGHKFVKVDDGGNVTVEKNFVGKAVITIQSEASGIYNAASKTIMVTVNPVGTKLLSVKSVSDRKMTVKWKKNASVTGYQIQYADNKKFKKAAIKKIGKKSKTSATYQKLKAKKTYYVRIRTYKKVSGKYYCSSWSRAKKVKIKK